MMVVVTGASGSGKSEYAEGVAVKLAGKDFKRLSVLSRWMKRLHRYACQSLWNRHVTHHMEEYVRQNF